MMLHWREKTTAVWPYFQQRFLLSSAWLLTWTAMYAMAWGVTNLILRRLAMLPHVGALQVLVCLIGQET